MENLPINAFDAFVLVVLLISGLLAFLNGFVQGVLSIISWAGGIAAAVYGLPYAQPYARQFITIEWIADAAAAVVLFILALFILSLIARALGGMVQGSGMNSLDRSLGLLFGLARGGLILGALFVFIVDVVWDPAERPTWLTEAKSTPLIDKAVAMAKGVAPREMSVIDKSAKQAADTAAQGIEAKRAFDKLTQPPPASAPPEPTAPGRPGETKKTDPSYSPSERQGLDRLFQTN